MGRGSDGSHSGERAGITRGLIIPEYQLYSNVMKTQVAMIVDIVRSRELRDRAKAQDRVRDAFLAADAAVAPIRPLWWTAGDEFQALYATAADAIAATTIVRATLPDGLDLRFGIGVGEVTEVASGTGATIYDGSAWWNARAAVEEAERRGARSGTARTWVISDEDAATANAALLTRDQLITTMKPRERRILAAMLRGSTQAEIAEAEEITQSAVSQSAGRSGARAVLQAHALWMEVAP